MNAFLPRLENIANKVRTLNFCHLILGAQREVNSKSGGVDIVFDTLPI